MTGRLQDRVALITGGASGIGQACARAFSAEGADVVIADLDESRASETIAAVEANGRQAAFVQTDTSREADCEAMVQAAVERFGKVDVLLAAAGISHALYESGATPRQAAGDREASFIVNKPPEYWEKVLSVNLTGVMLSNRAAARRMMEQGSGSIINIASGAATIPLPGAADYSVSKAGVRMLTKVLALEVAQYGVRVNAVGPGYTDTPMTASLRADEERRRTLEKSIPMGRLGQPEEIASTALFLASDESSYITGEIIFPAGGLFTG
ncbi:MAG: SDR family NAD(P)-dependent oxidoreductase [Dehalococcoidia bacterium]|nr:SDR family NAD(P)-dependent oxidoreductase [Dehalococcoidia bacterium]